MTLSVRSRNNSAVNQASLEMVGPIGSLMNAAASKVENLWVAYFHLIDLRRENDNLRRVVDRQSRQILQLSEQRLTNDRLRELLDFKQTVEGQYVGARVLAWDPGPWHQSVIIDVGRNNGIVENVPVLTDRGVVGRVVELSPNFAKVLLVTDPASGIDAFIQRNRVRSLIAGGGYGQLNMNYVRKTDDVRPGDLVVTSGLDGVFPAGLTIGSVTLVDKMSLGLFLEAQVTPGVNLSELQEVLVKTDPLVPVDWLSLGADLRERFEERALGGQ
jgi:rod shape-determining protein MreC